MSDPFAPLEKNDFVQLSDGRIARVVEIDYLTEHAYMELVFGELQPHDTVRNNLVFADRFRLTKMIIAEDTNE